MADDALTLAVAGRLYEGWTAIRVSRGIDRCATDFDIEVSERWANQDAPWQILPYTPCRITIGTDPVLTGYVDIYSPRMGPSAHTVQIQGRSKTEDLIDCTPDIKAGQFSGYSLAAIARSICALFGIEVVVQADAANTAVADATIERCETAFTFLECLGRLAGVLLTDDPQGRLVLTTAGIIRAAGRLVQGENLMEASAKLTSHRR